MALIRTVDSAVRERASRVANAMLPQIDDIGDATADYIFERIPELSRLGVLELTKASSRLGSATLVFALSRGDDASEIVPSAETLRIARDMVQHGVDRSVLTRGYRVGIAYWCERWSNAVTKFEPESEMRVAVVQYGTSFLLTWLEIMLDRIEAAYRDESDRLVQEGTLARAAYISSALDGGDFDPSEATLRLGYNFHGWHVALVLSRIKDEQPSAPLDSLARALAGSITNARPLVARADLDTTWCWIPTKKNDRASFEQVSVLVGQGQPGFGLEGFRRSHKQALDALRVGRKAAKRPGTVTKFDEIEIAALCSENHEQCRAFVLEQLGAIGEGTPEMGILRDTLWAFFNADSNFRATGAVLGIHHNTVRYRIGRAEEVLRHPVGQNRMKLELAIYLARSLELIGRP